MAVTSEKREEPASDPAPVTPEAPAAAPPAEPVSQATETPASSEGAPLAADATPHRKRRRRRRRHGPRPAGEQAVAGAAPPPASADGVTGEAATLPSSDAALQPAEGTAAPEPGTAREAAPAAPSATPPGEQPRRRRRRRRRRKPPPGAETGSPGATPEGAPAAATGEQSAATDARPPRKPWRERPRWRQREGESENRDQRSRDAGARTEGTRGGGPRGDREHGKRDRDRRDKRHGRPGKPGFGRGRDRDGHGKKPEQKLYAAESIVDRGFEDVAPAEEGGEARRVDWTIVKRMMVDQRSTQTVSTIYVLKRDGAETEFPYLAAAREAVKKKIVHPEKLTKPKEDYAALYTKK